MIRARFSPKAARDLDGISGLIAADNPEAAERVRLTILNTADFLPAVSGNHHGRSRATRGTGLDAVVFRLRKQLRLPAFPNRKSQIPR